MRRFTLLVRSYCHLCDEMQDALVAAASAIPVDLVDVDRPEHAALEARYGDAVPVLFLGAPDPVNEICRYRLDSARVAAALAGSGEIR